MGIRRRQFARVIRTGIQGAAFMATAGCAIITIRAPESNEVLRSGAVTLQVQKDDKSCSFNNGSFRAVLNRGRPNEVDLTSAFIRPPNSNVWVATDYPLTNGSHTLSVQAEFRGSACGASRVSTDSRTFEVNALSDRVAYQTSCGSGEFTFEPYPIVAPPGAMWPPPRYDVSTDAHCVSPGGTIQIGNFTTVYPDIASITQLDLVVLHTRWDPNQRDAGYQLGVWDRLAQPAFYPIREFRLTANGALIATLPVDVTREPPGGASIRMRYRSQSGQNREIDIEEQRSGRGVYSWGLFFVPLYKIYAATAEVGVGFNLFNHTVDGVFESGLPAGGWEEYCRIRYKNLSLGGFPGTVSFRDPNAWVQNPAQGYRVQMPATRTGSFDIVYQVVCPADRAPSGRSRFRGWALLGDYTLAAGQRWVRGMPPIESVDHP